MMKGKKTEKKLNSDIFLRLINIFQTKSWEIENDEANQLSVFNRFSSTLSELALEEQLLVLELTERFTRISFEEYLKHIKVMLNNIAVDGKIDLSKITTIHIAPLIAPEDFGKAKSSTTVQYLFKGVLNYNQHFANKRHVYTDGLDVSCDQINNEESILFVVDDFVGTGETACSAINFLINEKKIPTEKIVVLSIAALNEGVLLVNSLNVLMYFSLKLDKGITDFYPPNETTSKLILLASIEKRIKVHKNERFGFKNSEALVTLIRTPNNTFPVFWKEKKGRVAPFPRN
jgi:uracil phosphoribosyltransferase